MMKFRVTVQPEDEPISLAQARVFLRIDVPGFSGDTGQDSTLQSLIRAARQWIEDETDCAYGEQTIVAAADSFLPTLLWPAPSSGWTCLALPLPRGPVIEVTSVNYLANDGTDTLLAPTSYRLLQMAPQAIVPTRGNSWPSASYEPESVRVTYRAGYTLPDSDTTGAEEIYHPIIAAMRLLIGHLYVNRSASIAGVGQELPLGVRDLIRNSRRSIGI